MTCEVEGLLAAVGIFREVNHLGTIATVSGSGITLFGGRIDAAAALSLQGSIRLTKIASSFSSDARCFPARGSMICILANPAATTTRVVGRIESGLHWHALSTSLPA